MVTQLEHTVVAGTRPKTVNQVFTFDSLPLQHMLTTQKTPVIQKQRGGIP